MQRGCRGTDSLAMPAGQGGIDSFHAESGKTFREVLLEHGAGAWKQGTLELTLSAANAASIEVRHITPHRIRTDLASPLWIEATFADCGGGRPPKRTFALALDVPTLIDQGISDAGGAMDGVEYPENLSTADLGPDFALAGSTQGSIDITSTACDGNYEWNVDIDYTVAGDPTSYVATVGPFRTYGLASSTTTYPTIVAADGTPDFKEPRTIDGPACDVNSLGFTVPSAHTPPILTDYSGETEPGVSWTHLGSSISIKKDGSGTMGFGQDYSTYSSIAFQSTVQPDGSLAATATSSDGPVGNLAGTPFILRIEKGAAGPVLVGPSPLNFTQTDYWCQKNAWDQRCGS